ncbi:MAG: glycosyltransferase [Candidatus Methylacidiphilales bacterium]|nr:glycosyltransferase [Candidatus Methylacidiphilales bacterium]
MWTLPRLLSSSRRTSGPPDPKRGIHLIGDYSIAIGLGVAFRLLTRALRQAGYPLAHTQVNLTSDRRTGDHLEPDVQPEACDITLIHLNGDYMYEWIRHAAPALRDSKRVIGYWYWELPLFPEVWKKCLPHLDELWVSSRYVQDHAAAISPVPVVRIPPPIPRIHGTPRRADFGLPEDRTLFLFIFEPNSNIGRKNPFAIIEAFRKAFAGVADPPLLVLKTHHLHTVALHQQLAHDLNAALRAVGGIMVDASWEHPKLLDFIASCDVFVSLHRAEGFGLGMAEAMALCKPVIATGFSGNTDFMTPGNSYAVDYHLRRITAVDHRYQPEFAGVYEPGQWWAEPDINHAARLMRQLWEEPAEAALRAERGQASIRSLYSVEAIAETIRARLGSVNSWNGNDRKQRK